MPTWQWLVNNLNWGTSQLSNFFDATLTRSSGRSSNRHHYHTTHPLVVVEAARRRHGSEMRRSQQLSSSNLVLFVIFLLLLMVSCGALHCSWEKKTDLHGLSRHRSTCKLYQKASTLATQKRRDRVKELSNTLQKMAPAQVRVSSTSVSYRLTCRSSD